MDAFTLDLYLRKIRTLAENKYNDLLKELGISLQEFKILTYLYTYEGKITASKLAQIYEVTIAAIMHKTQSLEEKGLIEKKYVEQDNRKKYFILTEKGKKLCDDNFHNLEDYINKLILVLGENGIKFGEILEEIIQYMEEN